MLKMFNDFTIYNYIIYEVGMAVAVISMFL